MPSISTGFWVATTRNGGGTGCRTPSTVTVRSSITSSSADWVFGDARLISSAMTMLANTGPGWNSKPRVAWLKIVTPDTSEGSRSGVNWMRRHSPLHGGRDGPGQGRLADPGHVLQQHVPLGEQRGQRQPDHLRLAEHHRVDVLGQPGGQGGEALHLRLGERFVGVHGRRCSSPGGVSRWAGR